MLASKDEHSSRKRKTEHKNQPDIQLNHDIFISKISTMFKHIELILSLDQSKKVVWTDIEERSSVSLKSETKKTLKSIQIDDFAQIYHIVPSLYECDFEYIIPSDDEKTTEQTESDETNILVPDSTQNPFYNFFIKPNNDLFIDEINGTHKLVKKTSDRIPLALLNKRKDHFQDALLFLSKSPSQINYLANSINRNIFSNLPSYNNSTNRNKNDKNTKRDDDSLTSPTLQSPTNNMKKLNVQENFKSKSSLLFPLTANNHPLLSSITNNERNSNLSNSPMSSNNKQESSSPSQQVHLQMNNSNPNSTALLSLESLRQLAIERGAKQKRDIELLRQDKINKKNLSRLDHVLLVADTIRSIYTSKNKISFVLDDLVNLLSQQLLMVSQQDILHIIMTLIRQVPEFFVLVPRDNLCTQNVLKLNFQCHYVNEIRPKLKQYIESSKLHYQQILQTHQEALMTENS